MWFLFNLKSLIRADIQLKYTGVGKAAVGSRLATHHEYPPPPTHTHHTHTVQFCHMHVKLSNIQKAQTLDT